MNIAYCSLLLPEEKKLSERSKERLSGISGHKVTTATIKGIDANLDSPVTIFNIINTLNYPHFPQLIFPTEQWSHAECSKDWHIGYVNIIGIKYIMQTLTLYWKLSSWIKSKNNEACIICVQYIYYPAMLAACLLKKRYKKQVKLCLNTGDIPGKFGLKSQVKSGLKDFLIRNVIEKRIMSMAKFFDNFVFVTEDMATAFDVKEKPHVVVEGTYINPKYAEEEIYLNSEDKKKRIFYAGALRPEYGIEHLLRAFSMIKDNDFELVIAGGGTSEDLIKQFEKKDSRIKFLGFITPQEVLKQQKRATVLVSPRTSELEYVKYSFPSKALDSLASGVPYVAHKLPCDPPEYGNYIQYADNESDEALRNKLYDICCLSQMERNEIGKAAMDFILKEKSPEKICKKIVDMWRNL